jgi:hypothetical protein
MSSTLMKGIAALGVAVLVAGCGGGREQIPLADVPQVEIERPVPKDLPPGVDPSMISQ